LLLINRDLHQNGVLLQVGWDDFPSFCRFCLYVLDCFTQTPFVLNALALVGYTVIYSPPPIFIRPLSLIILLWLPKIIYLATLFRAPVIKDVIRLIIQHVIEHVIHQLYLIGFSYSGLALVHGAMFDYTALFRYYLASSERRTYPYPTIQKPSPNSTPVTHIYLPTKNRCTQFRFYKTHLFDSVLREVLSSLVFPTVLETFL